MSGLSRGDLLPLIVVPPPGPRSRDLAAKLQELESPNITFIADDFPIFWSQAFGANVLDVDGNVYVDLTAGFGVAAAGHRNPQVSDAIRRQLDSLAHTLGDVHPAENKVALLDRLARIAPGQLSRTILASSGAEAVEAALKTARLASGRPGVLCFTNAYHGLTYGALAVTDGDLFRAPFRDQLGLPILRAPFPDPYRRPPELASDEQLARAALQTVSGLLERSDIPIGAIIIEPIQGRGGIVVPPAGFLPGLRKLCDERGLVLIFDEIYTGFGRTGHWFACQHEDVVPDLLCVGKAFTGALPFSACVGRPEVMDAWPTSRGTAIHTSTFLGHPLGCAAALAQLDEIERLGLRANAARIGADLTARLRSLATRQPAIGDVRGRGLLVGIELVHPGSREPDPEAAAKLTLAALRRGLILLTSGAQANVLSISPPLTIHPRQIAHALDIIEDCLAVV